MQVNDILKIGNHSQIDLFIPGRTPINSYHYLENQLKEITERNEAPCILWNIRPWDNFNIIHAIYTNKIIELQNLGFNCQILLYDKLVEKILRLKNSNEIAQLKITVEKNINWLINSGLLINKTEFLFESFLWEQICFNDFSEKTTFFAQICDYNLSHLKIDEIFDRFWEIYYEVILNCDFLLTGGKDASEIWGMLRKKALNSNQFDYTPPTLFVFPQLEGVNGAKVSPMDADNLISSNDTRTGIYKKLEIANKDFLKNIVELFILPYTKNNVVYRDKELYISTFNSLSTELGSDYINYCTTLLYEYFTKVKNGK